MKLVCELYLRLLGRETTTSYDRGRKIFRTLNYKEFDFELKQYAMANGAIKSEKNKSGYIRNIAQPVSSTNNIEKARFNPILFTECSESASDEEKIELMSIGEDAKATETVRVNQNVLTREE